jgi:tRNA(Ile)-lysidine synthase
MNLQERLFEAIREYKLLPAGTRLVLGVSGGVDSLTLMHLLAQARHLMIFHMVALHIATLDHGLRGAQGADDAAYVAALAQSWELQVTVGAADVPALQSERSLSIEAAARIARYDFLAEVARQVGASHIATAHHADDQAETILHNLLRGTALKGLRGMDYRAPVPGHPDLTLIRPLLGVTRAELEAYCRQHGLQPRKDASNEDISLTRNRLRLETLPYLRQLAPQLDRHLLQLGEIAALEDDFAASALHQAVASHITHHEGRITIPRRVFAALHPALQRRFVLWSAQELGEGRDVSYVHITAAVALALVGQVGARAQLKGGVQLRVDYAHIVIEYADEPLDESFPLLPHGAAFSVSLPAEIGLNAGWKFYASLSPIEGQGVAQIAVPQGSALLLRGRRPGDRFPSSNDSTAPTEATTSTHKLKDWMIDHKVPRHLRERLPLFVVNGQVAAVWWQGWSVSRHFAPTTAENNPVYFSIK